MLTSTPAARVSRGVRLGYGLGSFCTGTFSSVPGLLLLFYMTNVLAVPAWLAGLVAFLPKAWDLFINPYVGRLSDRTRSPMGPRRPWLLVGALTLPPAFALTFAGPPLTGVPAAVYVTVLFFLAATAYAFFEVPYKAMPAEMTDDYHERSSLLQWRMVFLGFAILLSSAGTQQLLNSGLGGDTLGGYRLVGIVVGVVLLAAMLGTFFGTARAPMVAQAEAEPSLRAQIAAARGNRSFLLVLGLSCAQMAAAGIMLAGTPYFASYTLERPSATTTLMLCIVGPLLATMPLWMWVSRRLDKRGAMILASALYLAGALALAFTPALGAGYAHGCALLVGIGFAGLQLLQFSMLADVIAADTAVSGKRRAGLFTGLWTAAETVVFAAGAMFLGGVLAAFGFVSSDPSAPVRQTDTAILGTLLGGTVLPAAFIALS
ncbi:MFS transporter, partial [Bailinhaonella thermotolerans]|uniref:MFS transporter n=1 Tax=Bailinhaonella thermotolerans TaxID=1070861 RepID=UPI001F5BDD88